MKSLNINTQSIKAKQGASTKRIGQYLRRWLGWSLVACCGAMPAYSAPGDPYGPDGSCGTAPGATDSTFFANATITIFFNDDEETSISIQGNSDFVRMDGAYSFFTYSSIPPTTATLTPEIMGQVADEPASSASPQTVYVSLGAGLNNEVCTYQYTLQGVGAALTRTNPSVYTRLAPAVSDPTAVPIFTPLGLIATISGLLWFGRRRSIKLKSAE